jgi:hypothetical protein
MAVTAVAVDEDGEDEDEDEETSWGMNKPIRRAENVTAPWTDGEDNDVGRACDDVFDCCLFVDAELTSALGSSC